MKAPAKVFAKVRARLDLSPTQYVRPETRAVLGKRVQVLGPHHANERGTAPRWSGYDVAFKRGGKTVRVANLSAEFFTLGENPRKWRFPAPIVKKFGRRLSAAYWPGLGFRFPCDFSSMPKVQARAVHRWVGGFLK